MRRFKSRKERLGRAPAGACERPAGRVSNPGRNVWDSPGPGRGPRRTPPVSNPGRNVWDGHLEATRSTASRFQIPEGTFGTREAGGEEACNAEFQIPEGTFGTAGSGALRHPPHARFKSRKERLGPIVNVDERGEKELFQIPEGTFGTRVIRLPVLVAALKFQIPEGTFGTWVIRSGRRALSPGFKSRKERLGPTVDADGRVAEPAFQIPEGTFGTLWLRVLGRI